MGRKRTAKSGETRTRTLRKPRILAAIDVGATSIRMEIAQANPDGTLLPLEQLVHPIALGSDTFRVGYVTPATLRAVCQVLRNFSSLTRTYQVDMVRAVATSAIRDASNQDILLDRIKHETGIVLTVLDAVGETRLTYQTLLPFLKQHLPSDDTHTLLVDLGGGSTEIMVLRGEDLAFCNTRRIGTSRTFYRVSEADCMDQQALMESVTRNIVNSALEVFRAYPVSQCIVINSLLLRALQQVPEATVLQNGLSVPTQVVAAIAEDAAALPAEKLAQRFGIGVADAELLLPALLLLQRFLHGIRVDAVMFAEIDLLSGILNDLRMEMFHKNPFALFQKQIIYSARSVAQRFLADTTHSFHVATLACQLFDGVAQYFDLGKRDRLFLEVAGILHDAGMFISERSHHKHSAYLIRWTDIVGLSEDDREMIAQIARYHRKSSPKPQHPDFMALPAAVRLRVTKLAAILRIADALDRPHRQGVSAVRVELKETSLDLHVTARHEVSVETAALRDKGDLFERITGLTIKLRRHLT